MLESAGEPLLDAPSLCDKMTGGSHGELRTCTDDENVRSFVLVRHHAGGLIQNAQME